jgi:hypothetical protein
MKSVKTAGEAQIYLRDSPLLATWYLLSFSVCLDV